MVLFQCVRLLTDRYAARGVKKGDIGVILEVYDESHFEIEFSDARGRTIAFFAVTAGELEPVEAN